MLVVGDPESREEWRRKAVLDARVALAAAGVAVFPDIERAVRTMGRYVRYERERAERADQDARA